MDKKVSYHWALGPILLNFFARNLRIFVPSWSVCQNRLEKNYLGQTLWLSMKIRKLRTKKRQRKRKKGERERKREQGTE
jgi:hypothetical protein